MAVVGPQTSSDSAAAPVVLAYQTPAPYGKAALLVRLVGIFSLVSAGFDLLQAGVAVVMIVAMHYLATFVAAMPPAAPGPVAPAPAAVPGPGAAPAAGPVAPAPPFPPVTQFYALYGIPAALCLAALGFKIFGGIRLLRRGRHAWGWGLATAILGCCEIWMFSACCLMAIIPMGVGIFSLVVMCLPNVRFYLRPGQGVLWGG